MASSFSSNWTTIKPAASYISDELNVPLLQGIVGATCGLSVVGSLLIIVTFICFKELRSTGRLLLVQLSAMDFLTAAANLAGIFIIQNMTKQRARDGYTQDGYTQDGYEIACQIQGHLAMFATNSSILWTDALALYLLIILISRKPKVARYSTYFMYIVCYGVPLVVNIALAVDKDIGLDNGTAGWCAIAAKPPGQSSYFPFLFGNDLWVMLSFVFLPGVYIIMKGYMWRAKKRMQRSEQAPLLSSSSNYERVRVVEWKLMLVPLIFILLRVWSLAVGIHVDYRMLSIAPANYWVYYVADAGDSGQGFLNGILWCVLSVAVWQKLCSCSRSCAHTVKLFCVLCCNRYKKKTSSLFKPIQRSDGAFTPTSGYSTPLESQVSSLDLEMSSEYERIKY